MRRTSVPSDLSCVGVVRSFSRCRLVLAVVVHRKCRRVGRRHIKCESSVPIVHGDVESVGGAESSDNDQDETIQLVRGLSNRGLNAPVVEIRGQRLWGWVRMPITNVMESTAMTLQNLLLLGLSIRSIGRSRAMVAPAGSGSFFDDDRIAREGREELTARFSVSTC